MRRLPTYLVVQTSGNTSGVIIQTLNNGITSMIDVLNDDPMVIETVHMKMYTPTLTKSTDSVNPLSVICMYVTVEVAEGIC